MASGARTPVGRGANGPAYGTSNRYALAGGNPVSYADPGGREPCNDGTGANAVTQTLNNLCGGVKGFAEAGGEAISGAAEYMWATNPSNPDYQSNMLAMGSNALDFGRRAQADPAGAAQQAWDGYTAPIREDWNAGNRWEAGGRAVFDGVGFLTGGRTLATKAAGTAGKLSGATSLEQRMIRATSVQRSLGPAPSGKVIAETTSGTRTVSGWAGAPGYENGVGAAQRLGSQTSFTFKRAGAFDQGVPGRYYASYAEVQAQALRQGEDVAVSAPMCKQCQDFYSHYARYRGEQLVVSDPDTTHVFPR
jgi:hypothetical protein